MCPIREDSENGKKSRTIVSKYSFPVVSAESDGSSPSSSTSNIPISAAAPNRNSGSDAMLKKPAAPPPRAHRAQANGCVSTDLDACKFCHTIGSLFTDWSQGDRVCTSCGVVNEESLLDETPEWNSYRDDNDGGGVGTKARAGIVTDETLYIGGLQPTVLSKTVFGAGARDPRKVRQALHATNVRMNTAIENAHRAAFKSASETVKIRMKKRMEKRSKVEADDATNSDTEDCSLLSQNLPPDYGSNTGHWMEEEYERQLMDEEVDHCRQSEALHSDKWSLNHAKNYTGIAEDKETKLDNATRQATADMKTGYDLLVVAANALNLPNNVIEEAAMYLSRYASKNDGFRVPGVVSRQTSIRKTSSSVRAYKNRRQSNCKGASPSSPKESADDNTVDLETLRENNKIQQIRSLNAALLFWVGRKHQRQRSLIAVCEAVHIPRKLCSKAMAELKKSFPDLALPVPLNNDAIPLSIEAKASNIKSSDIVLPQISEEAVNDCVAHSLRRIDFSPVAESCVRYLVLDHVQHDKVAILPLVTGAMTYFVSCAGSQMQALACQARKDINKVNKKRRSLTGNSKFSQRAIKQKNGSVSNDLSRQRDDDFDVLSEKCSATSVLDEQSLYNVQLMWDAWSEQLPWDRQLASIEQSCGISRSRIYEFYKTVVFPKRKCLLTKLTSESGNTIAGPAALTSSSRLAKLLLTKIAAAASVMKCKQH